VGMNFLVLGGVFRGYSYHHRDREVNGEGVGRMEPGQLAGGRSMF